MIRPHVPGHGSRKRCSLLPPISWIRPQIGLNNMNMIFRWILLRYSNHLQFKLDLIPTNMFNEIKWLNITNRLKKIPSVNIKYHMQYLYTRKSWKCGINFFEQLCRVLELLHTANFWICRVPAMAHGKENGHPQWHQLRQVCRVP